MVLTGLEIILIGAVVSCIGYIVGRFDKRITHLEETVGQILLRKEE